MIGLDTNILVRYFAQDDPVQSAVATDVVERRLTQNEPGFISVMAMAETVWVLARAYRLSKEGIVNAVERMLRTETLVVESEREVFTAMTALREGRGEFDDALIGALSTRASCSRILTFDRQALRLPGFELP
jgi:predicted nucleic-acid-binding protein